MAIKFLNNSSVTGQLTVTNGIEMTSGNFNAGDNERIRLGNSADLQIYHDGSNSYISDVGIGDLIISADNDLTFKDGSGNIMANMNASNSVELMYGNVKKFETTASGVNVIGDITTSGNANVSGGNITLSGSYPRFNMYSNDVGEDDWSIINNNGIFGIYNTTASAYALSISETVNTVIINSGNLQLNGTGRITGVDTVSAGTDAANKTYVDNAVAGVPIGNYLPLAGGTMTGVTQFNDHTQHGDQVSARWGAGNDLTIKHNATDSFFENNTGHLNIVNYANDKDIALWNDDGTGGIAKYLVLNGTTTHAYFLNPGNVGIGTTSPNDKLNIHSSDASGNIGLKITRGTQTHGLRLGVNDSHAFLWTTEPQDIAFGTNNSQRVTIKSNGNVGIGTTSPSNYRLQVDGTVESSAFSVEGASARIFAPSGANYNGNGTQTGFLIAKLPDNGPNGVNNMMTGVIRVFDYSDNESFDVHFAGYWYSGYNWTNCNAWIDSAADEDRNFTVRFGRMTGSAGADTRPYIMIGEANSTWSYCKFSVINYEPGHSNYEAYKWDKGWSMDINATNPGNVLLTKSNAQVNNWKRNGQDIYYGSGTGDVGIGTSSPSRKLSVRSNGSSMVADFRSASGNNSFISFSNNASTADQVRLGSTSGNLVLSTNYTERLRIDSNGNVGIGTTNPGAKLEVSDTTTGIGAIVGNTTHNSRLQIYTAATGKNSEIWFGDSADDSVGIIDYDHANDSMSFVVGATKRLSIDAAGTMLLGDSSTAYQTIFFDPTPGTVYGNGTLQIQPTTAPGSGVAQFTTNFADRVGGGTTKHNLRVGGTVTATNFIGDSGAYLPLAAGSSNPLTGDLFIGGTDVPSLYLQRNDNTYQPVIRLVKSNDNLLIGHTAIDEVIFYDDAGEAMRLDGSGNLGIGTTSPARKLDVNSSGSSDIARFGNDSGNFTLGQTTNLTSLDLAASNAYRIRQGSSTPFYIKSDGNVGIGDTNPESALEVNEDSNYKGIHVRGSNAPVVSFAQGTTSTAEWKVGISGNDGDSFSISQGTANTDRLFIKDDGNVGIGATNPLRKLHVVGNFAVNAGTDEYYGVNITGGESANPNILIGDWHNSSANISWDSAGNYLRIDSQHSTSGAPIVFSGNDAATEYMRITPTGNVGIGTTTPLAPLHVAAASNFKVAKIGNDLLTHYSFSGLSNHTLTLTCGSYYQAEVTITANQTNGGDYNNVYIRGIWSNNHTSHHWDELENVGFLTGSSFTITVSENTTTNSGKLIIQHNYSSQSFSGATVRVTDFYGTHAYTLT